MKRNILWIALVLINNATYIETLAQSSTAAHKELKSVNTVALKFGKKNGKPVDFKLGLSISDSSDVKIGVDPAYQITELRVLLVRGKWPVSASTYNSESNEILVEWKDFLNAQPGDRLCIDFVEVQERKGTQLIPVNLDVPVFNIPLN
ncbi:MAG: hypothetical protein H7259_09540 [Cytophagales bacterium]|nr:hypothetical protein [Cytophaga sp.]